VLTTMDGRRSRGAAGANARAGERRPGSATPHRAPSRTWVQSLGAGDGRSLP